VINTYFRRPDIPIGVLKASKPDYDCPRRWAEDIISRYPHAVRSHRDALDAVTLYRRTLSAEPDTSVTIATVGYLTNLANLLDSGPDEYSSLDGRQLVQRKVRRLVSMAGGIDTTGTGGYESNVLADIAASQKVFAEWPAPITLSGFEIGVEIFTGIRLVNNDSIRHSPVKDAYRISLAYDNSTTGRYSWDQTAVLVAVRGVEPYFGSRQLDFVIEDDGRNSLVPGDRITYLTRKNDPSEIARLIEELMMHQPGR
jgi:inosine-uridine nucleoside N-ribohydrolase